VSEAERAPFNWKERAGIVLMVLSLMVSASILGVPWLDGSTAWKATVAGGLLVAAEAVFWVGVLIAGRDFMRRYRAWFSVERLKALWADTNKPTRESERIDD
jgi:hypothetical protein